MDGEAFERVPCYSNLPYEAEKLFACLFTDFWSSASPLWVQESMPNLIETKHPFSWMIKFTFKNF